jgi:hypothetical protein
VQAQPDHPHGRTPRARDVDPDRAHQAALEREDDLVQQLVVAKYALSISRTGEAMDAVDSALSLARQSLSELLPAIEPAGPQRQTSAPSAGYAGRLIRSSATGSGSAERYDEGPHVESLSAVPRQLST